MKELLCLMIAMLLSAGGNAAFADPSGKSLQDFQPPLRDLAAEYGFRIGICLSYDQLRDQKYLGFLGAQFNTTTCTNETKAYSLLDQNACRRSEDGMPRMNYEKADRMIQWAADHGIAVRGHVLTWDAYMSEWFFHEGYDSSKPFASREVMLERLESYITQVMTHFETKFPGVIYCWDVVNEAMGDSEGEIVPGDPRRLRTTRNGQPNLFYQQIGDDYVEYSFLYARNAQEALGTEIGLFYNDYNMLYPAKREAARALVESLNSFSLDESGKPRRLIDGIGMQGYMGGYGVQDGCLSQELISNTEASILAFAGLGMEVHITEMALRNYDPEKSEAHAAFYGKMFRMLAGINERLGRNVLTGVTIWGVQDVTPNPWNEYSWKLNSTYGGILTEKGELKTSFDAMYDALLR